MKGRIPEVFLDDLLARTDLVEVINGYVPLKRTGKNYAACCPFHQEKSPSFTVSPDKQFYYCFGCGASGNAISFIMDYTRLDFIETVEQLAKSLGMPIPQDEQSNQRPKENLEPLYQLLEMATKHFEKQLRNPATKTRPVDYLKARGLSGQTAKQFRLGFAPPGWDNLINALGNDQSSKDNLIRAGVAGKNQYGKLYDLLRDRITFPIRDNRGRVIAFGGRVLGDEKPKYLNSPETPVFHKGHELYGLYEARQSNNRIQRFVVVEGYMDVIALAQFGISYAVATLGTATSESHVEKLFRHSDELIFCFDGDEAGRRAAWRALENALPTMRDGRQIKFLLLPDGEDPDTVVRKDGKTYFEGLLDEALPLSEFFFQHIGKGIQLSTLDGRARLASLTKPYLDQLPGGVFQQLMLQQLQNITQLDDIQLALDASTKEKTPPLQSVSAPQYTSKYTQEGDLSAGGPAQQPEPEPPPSQVKQPRQRKPLSPNNIQPEGLTLVDNTIRMLLNTPDQASTIDMPGDLHSFTAPRMNVLLELFDFLKQKPDASTASILGYWQNRESGGIVFELAAKEFILPHKAQSPELSDALRKLHLQKVEQDLDQIIAEGVKDKTRFKELLHLQKNLANK